MASDSLSLRIQPCSALSFSQMLYDTDLPLDFVPLPDGLSSDSSLSGSPTSPLDSNLLSLAHIATRSPAGNSSSMSLGPTGFDSAAYTRVLRQHQIRLKQVNDEYERLKMTHEGLVETHRLLMVAFAEATKRPRTADHEPPTGSPSSSSLPPTFIPVAKLSPLMQSDYPGVKFWNKLDWKKTENSRKDSSELEARSSGRGGARSSKGENVMMLYIEDTDGSPVDGTLASAIREFARSIWRGFYSQGIAPEKWGDAPQEVRDKYCHEMESAFFVLRYCDNHWKAHAVATSIYSQWYHTFDKKKHQAIKEEPGPLDVTDEPARKKSKTTISDMDADDTQSSHSEGHPNDAVTSESTPKAIILNDPLANIFDNQASTQFPVLETVPQAIPPTYNVNCDNAHNSTNSELHSDAATQRSPTAVTIAASNGPDQLNAIGSTNTEPNSSTIPPNPDPLVQPDIPPSVSPTLETTPQVDSHTVIPSSPMGPATACGQGGLAHKKYARSTKMQPGSAITARNLCAMDWCAEFTTGTTGEFSRYWDTLDFESKAAYREKEKKERALRAGQRKPTSRRSGTGISDSTG